MTTKTLVSLLVGMHFRPPAKQLLEGLPAGQGFDLIPEPENPYDESALKVMLDLSQIPEEFHSGLDGKLQGTGFDLQELLALGEPLQMGYIAASGGKPLLKAGLEVGNKEFLEALHWDGIAIMPGGTIHPNGPWKATLGFDPKGLPLVHLVVDDGT